MFLIALPSSVLIAKVAGNVKDMAVRNSPRVLVLGTAANLFIMLGVLVLVLLKDQSIGTLQFAFHADDALVSFISIILTFLLAIGFILLLAHRQYIDTMEISRPAASWRDATGLALGLGLLLVVALQEEVLNRGYVTLNLLSRSALTIILTSTILFVLIHFLTNHASPYQVVSWVVGGLVLVLAYLLSGSLWVPIIIHYAMDSANLLVFNITGQFSVFKTSPALNDRQRAVFRVAYSASIMTILLSVYGLHFTLP